MEQQSRSCARVLLLKVVLFVVLFLGVLHPLEDIVCDDHDSGSMAAGEYWTVHKLAYGVDVVQNIGPLGFISFPNMYTGFIGYGKFALTCLLAVVLAGLSVRTAWLLPGDKLKMAFLLLVWIFTEANSQYYLLTLLIGYTLYFPAGIALSLALIPILVILSLAKSTLLFIALFIVGLAALHHALARRWLFAVLLPCSFVILFVAVWWLVDQPVANIFSFVLGALHFSQGYNEALSYFETGSVSIMGFASLGLAIIAILCHRPGVMRLASGRKLADAAVLALIEGIVLFVAWKHGFVRADGHVVIFFEFLAMAAPLIIWLPCPERALLTTREVGLRSLLLTVIIILCICGVERTYRFHSLGQILVFGTEWNRMEKNASILSNVPGHLARLEAQFAESVKSFDMPRVNAISAHQDVSYFGIMPGVMVYNRFVYRPMPSTIPFAASNPWIMAKDTAFFRDEATAPRFVLYHLDAIDNALSAQYDSFAQLELLQHYDVAFEERENLVLTRRSTTRTPTLKPEGPEEKYPLETWVEVPHQALPVWTRINMPHTLVGDVLSTLYKPPEYSIEYTLANGKTVTRKMKVEMVRIGLMVAPLITDNDSYAAANDAGEYGRYLTGHSDKLDRITRFRAHCVREKMSCPKDFTVSFDSIEGLELGRMPGSGKQ